MRRGARSLRPLTGKVAKQTVRRVETVDRTALEIDLFPAAGRVAKLANVGSLEKPVALAAAAHQVQDVTDLLARRFIADGFVKIENAVPSEVAQACAELLWAEIKKDPDDEATWTQPVYWVGDMAQEPFVQAANASVLHEAFDALVGPGRWMPRSSLGSFPLRFPHSDEPDDAGWHVE